MNIDFIEKINKKNIFEYFPELQILETVIEKNICHNNESVFDHTLKVFSNCRDITYLLNQDQLNHFNKTIDGEKIKDIFLIAVLFHDIGKTKTIKVKNNITTCKDHEKIDIKLLKQTQLNKLSDNQFKYLRKIIKNHTLIDFCLDDKDRFNEKYFKLEKKYQDIILEMTVLALADIYRGDLEKNNKLEYKYRVKILSGKLEINL